MLSEQSAGQIHKPGTDLNGDELPAGAVARIGTLRLRHQGSVCSLAYSPDGKTIASTGDDHYVRLWDAATGKELRSWQITQGYRSSVAFSSDGKILASAGGDGKIVLWDPTSGEEVNRLEGHALTDWTALAFSPDGRILGAALGTLQFWDLTTGRKLAALEDDHEYTHAVLFTPDGKYAAFASSRDAGLCDPRTGKETRKNAGCMAITLSEDGKRLAVVSQTESKIDILDTATGKQLCQAPGHFAPFSLALSPDGEILAGTTFQHDILLLFNTVTKQERWLASGKSARGGFHALAFSPDAKTLATAGVDGRVRLWDVKAGVEKSPLPANQNGGLKASLLPDGRTVLTLSEDGRVRLWETVTGKLLMQLAYEVPYQKSVIDQKGNLSSRWITKDMPMSFFDLSKDGKTLITGCVDGTILIWDLAARQCRKRLATPEQVLPPFATQFAVLTPDATTLAIKFEQTIYVRDIPSGKTLWTIPDSLRMCTAAFALDGKTLLTGGHEGILRVWDVAAGKEIQRWSPHGGHAIYGIAFSDDGKLMATVGGDNFVALWEPHTHKLLHRFATHSARLAISIWVAFSHNGKLVAAPESDNELAIWEIETGTCHRIQGHYNIVASLAFTPRDALAISGSADGTALVWDLARITKPRQPAGTESVRTDLAARALPPGVKARLGDAHFQTQGGLGNVLLAPDGRSVAVHRSTNDGNSFRILDVHTGKQLHDLSESVFGHVIYSPDGKILAEFADKSVILWNAATAERTQQFVAHPDHVSCVAFSPDAKILATGGGYYAEVKDTPVLLWDVANTKQIGQLAGPRTEVEQLAFSADGKWLACCTEGEVLIWDIRAGKLVRRLARLEKATEVLVNARHLATYKGGTLCLRDLADDRVCFRLTGDFSAWRFSSDSKILATLGKDEMLRLWDVPTGKERRHFKLPHHEYSLAFSADSSTLALSDDNSLRFWNTLTGEEVGPHSGHQGAVTTLAYAPDGKWLASGSIDYTIRLWETHSGRELHVLAGHNATITSVLVSPDGKHVASADAENTVCLWEARTGHRLVRVARPIKDGDGWPVGIAGLAFTGDCKSLIAGSHDGTIRLLETATGKETRSFKAQLETLRSLALEPGGQLLACADGAPFQDGSILLLDLNNGKELRRITPRIRKPEEEATPSTVTVWRIRFSPDGKVLAVSESIHEHFHGHLHGHAVRLWETATGKEIVALETPGYIGALAFSDDGKTLAFGGGAESVGNDQTVHVWDLTTEHDLGSLTGHLGWISALAFSPDRSALASGSTDNTMLLWDTSWPALKKRRWPAPEPRKFEDLWSDLANPDAAVAYKAIGRLSKIPAETIPFLEKRLQPVSEAEWRRIEQWIADLDSNRFPVRHNASNELEKIGGLAEPLLCQALAKRPSLEMRQRIAALQEKLQQQGPPHGRLRTLRAITVLEWIGNSESRQILKSLASGVPESPETKDATAALKRLAK